MSEDTARRARELVEQMDAMDPDDIQVLIRSLSVEELRAVRAELAARTGGES